MNTPDRDGRTLGPFGTSIAALFGMAALAAPAQTIASVELPSATATRAATTTWRFDDIPVRSALQLLAEEGGFNLVVSDAVTGNVTLHLQDVTWEQVLAVVLRMKGLEQQLAGGTRTIDRRG